MIRNACVNDGSPESGHEHRNADVLRDLLDGRGLDMEVYEPLPGRSSLVARFEGRDPDAPALALLGHTDVVPANGEDWRHDPFGGEIIDGEVWGRGAVDMLNLTASMAVAVRHLADEGFRPEGDLLFIGVADEEALGSHGAQWLTEHIAEEVGCDYLITEAGGFPMGSPDGVRLPVITGEKGAFWCTMTVRGTPGHASQPLRTDNALVKAAEVVRRLAEHDTPADIHDAWRRFVEGIGLPAEFTVALLDPDRIGEFCRHASVARPRPPGARLHPHDHGPHDHARRDQGQRDPRPGGAAGRHPHPAGVGPGRRRGHARRRPRATWPATSR